MLCATQTNRAEFGLCLAPVKFAALADNVLMQSSIGVLLAYNRVLCTTQTNRAEVGDCLAPVNFAALADNVLVQLWVGVCRA